jgi:hypothetical protein
MWRAVFLGMVMMALPGLAAALLVRADEPAAPTWPQSPRERPPAAAPEARWDVPARESLSLLRRVTAKEARESVAALAACESRAVRATGKGRNKDFRRCATTPLSRTGGFASANSRMLSSLAGSAGPTRACRGRVLALSGANGSLASTAQAALRGLDMPWVEVLAASRAIRALSDEALRLARAPGWHDACPLRPPAPPPPEPVA